MILGGQGLTKVLDTFEKCCPEQDTSEFIYMTFLLLLLVPVLLTRPKVPRVSNLRSSTVSLLLLSPVTLDV